MSLALRNNHRNFEANHAIILEEQKLIRKNLLQQEDSDNEDYKLKYKLSQHDKAQIFGEIREELELIDELRKERLNTCSNIYESSFQQQRK